MGHWDVIIFLFQTFQKIKREKGKGRKRKIYRKFGIRNKNRPKLSHPSQISERYDKKEKIIKVIPENIDISLGNSWDIGTLLYSYFKFFKKKKGEKIKRKEEKVYRKFGIRNKLF